MSAQNTNSTQTQTQEQKSNEQTFTARNLREFSPYRVSGIETIVKPVSGTTKDGRTYSFDSKTHILTIIPQKNETALIKVRMFDKEYQTLLAIATVYGGFDRVWITTTIDPSSTSRNLVLNHTSAARAQK